MPAANKAVPRAVDPHCHPRHFVPARERSPCPRPQPPALVLMPNGHNRPGAQRRTLKVWKFFAEVP